MTVADFWFVTLTAQVQSNRLFNPGSSATETNGAWCTSMVNTSAICIAEKRGMMENGIIGYNAINITKPGENEDSDRLVGFFVVFEIFMIALGGIVWCNMKRINDCMKSARVVPRVLLDHHLHVHQHYHQKVFYHKTKMWKANYQCWMAAVSIE